MKEWTPPLAEYMQVPCKYCKKKKLLALNQREYNTGLFVVSAKCDSCGKNQKISNHIKKAKK